MKKLLIIAFVLNGFWGMGQTVELVKDINITSDLLVRNHSAVTINGIIYFSKDDGINGYALWKSDGTNEGTVMVKDLYNGVSSEGPKLLINHNGTLYFHAIYTAVGGYKYGLFKSDGTEQGTVLVKETTQIEEIKSVGSQIFFRNGKELWKSDGTEAGTIFVKGFGINGYLYNLFNYNGTLVFAAADNDTNIELWKTNGTTSGTVQLKDLNPTSWGQPDEFTIMNGTLYFSAFNGTVREFWKSDGTTAGTLKVKTSGQLPLFVSSIYATSNLIYFYGYNSLWKSDGTDAGTVQIINAQIIITNFCHIGNIVYFRGENTATGAELWRSDGTAAGTYIVKDIIPFAQSSNPFGLINFNGILYFKAETKHNIYQNETSFLRKLYKSDGTSTGTVEVKEFQFMDYGSAGGSDNPQFTISNNKLYFFGANKETGDELWTTDGTNVGTTLVKDINLNTLPSSPQEMTVHGNELFFAADDGINGKELWKSDGTNAGTTIVKDIRTNNGQQIESSNPYAFLSFNSLFVFLATNYNNNTLTSIYKSDGTSAGTTLFSNENVVNKMVKMGDYIYYYVYSNLSRKLRKTNLQTTEDVASFFMVGEIYKQNNKLFFLAYTAADPIIRLWVSDGTTTGTYPISPINKSVTSFGPGLNQVFFNIYTNTFGIYDLYKTDGTISGTSLINPNLQAPFINYGWEFKSHSNNSRFFFYGYDYIENVGNTHLGLYSSDGTNTGAILLKEGPLNNVLFNSIIYNNLLFFGKTSQDNSNFEVYKSDGTIAGTTLIKTIPNSYYNPNINFTFSSNNNAFFSLNQSNRSLWRTDGTDLGTIKLLDNFITQTFFDYNGATYFSGFDEITGIKKIYKTDGTLAGTTLILNDFVSGNFVNFNNSLYYSKDDSKVGAELFKFSAPIPCTPPPSPPTATGTTILPNTTASLTATGCSTYNWYALATGTNLLFTGQNFTTPPLNASTSYFVACTDGNACESARTEVVVIVNCTTMYTTKSGDINDPTVWSCNRIPSALDIITVETGHIINIPAGTFSVKNIVLKGDINYSVNGVLTLN